MFAKNAYTNGRPIHNRKIAYSRVVTERSIIEWGNERTLLRYVYMALADHNMLSTHWVREEEAEKTGEKSYSVQIYGEDLGFRFGKQVMFANKEDVQKLYKILVAKIGKERLHILRYSINTDDPDDLNKAGMEMREKWKEEWPL